MKFSFVPGWSGAVILGLGVATAAQAQTAVPGDPLTGNGTVSRTLLTYTTLNTLSTSSAPVNDSAYAVPTGAAPPTDNFQGTLAFSSAKLTTPNYTDLYNNGTYSSLYNPDNYPSSWGHLPTFSFQFVQNGSWLIPVNQGWQVTGSTHWNYIIGPGRAWTESTDHGYTRASLPFSIVEYNQNCVHQGEMTFLFSNTLSPNISDVNYQITYESCAYWHFNLWGTIAATYTPSTISNATTLETAEATEITNRIPVKPFASIATDYPNSGFTASNFTSEFTYPSDIASYGVYFNGVNYVAGCSTRYGTYAFCSEMRFPSYSVAKTAYVDMALTKLGYDYGSTVYSQLIKNWISNTYVSQGGIWTNVTFANTSNMATGNYASSSFEVDEDSNQMNIDIIDVVPYTTKIGNAFKYFSSNSATPGTLWVYHTSDSFMLASAMQYFLQSKTTSSADVMSYLNTNVYIPLTLSAGMMNIMRTDDAASATSTAGYPLGGYGMFFNQDDIVKIAKFMNTGTGAISGTQTIDATRLQDSIFRSSNPGLVVPDSGLYPTYYYSSPPVANTNHYQNDVWEKTYTPTEYSSFTCSFDAPYMSGYGGNTVTLFPNGAIYYMFSDGLEYYQDNAAVEINKLAPMCPANPATLAVSALSFASTTVAPVTQTLTITNPNAETISLAVPIISGTNASLFSVGSYCSQLTANSSCTLTITYTPTATGNSSATLTVPTSDSYVIGTTITANSSTAIPLLGYVGPARTVPTITWGTPAPITYGTALSGTQLNASTPTAGTFTYLPASGTVLAPGTQTLLATFIPTSLSTYSPTTQSVSLLVNQVPTSVSWAPPTLQIYAGSTIGASILNASSTTAGTIAYTATPNGGTASAVTASSVLPAGTYTLTATLTPTNSVDYATSSSSQTLVVTTQNIWAVNSGGSVSELNAAGVPLTSSGISCGGTGAAVDNAGSIWSLSPSTSSVCKLSNVGAVLLSGATGGGISAPSALAIDGAGQVWIANGNNSVSVLSNAGAAITPSSGYTDNTISGPNAIAIDNSGNVWLSNATSSSVDEILGAAVPVAPLANAVQNSTLGAKP